jgi:hypothetical protein
MHIRREVKLIEPHPGLHRSYANLRFAHRFTLEKSYDFCKEPRNPVTIY